MLLALDTSTSQLGLALYDGERLLAERLWVSKVRHTVELAPAVEQILQQSGLALSALTALGVALGPGSFTSLRVGLAFAKGLAFSLTLPLIGISTLAILAAPLTPTKDSALACLLSAGRGRLAVGWYEASAGGWQASAANPLVTTAEALAAEITSPTFLTGELTGAERQILTKNEKISLASPAAAARRPGMLAELAWRRWQAGESDPLAALAPIYLHVGPAIPG
ncbi:MAG: tRNA (adenosine(37)-N6)-threonylcarbamoyltransferase complex dimerization subunit type 1 TsaB [Anaerolineae bacterium CG_4_9_14_3_um_filter_57_17]|nr:tRNA (adenosine(37)-N6)-threonylcarbamoyltransferase complex dimerization subunit type 1 TsaB [bacterium]NCT20651.1 tRNA (adenosine(37)-N6)-threonylcarbamoyltransferase complex dimerization subunit type 1 TsaB [bacterium]OIO85692.1 MAG: tRNA (adenosine(37)-N6)-threonylcarbamoyltransferase complex dimerization subunit type 1 TsaB [Anaerolineae bacterium CG2_30_57_67]PIY38593.1 MAG: tRNA (adenosine(37)-N6)-threonylcarbamoyltransferase complex dimerization subunit type 1 TsaB [Armatimonadetes ba